MKVLFISRLNAYTVRDERNINIFETSMFVEHSWFYRNLLIFIIFIIAKYWCRFIWHCHQFFDSQKFFFTSLFTLEDIRNTFPSYYFSNASVSQLYYVQDNFLVLKTIFILKIEEMQINLHCIMAFQKKKKRFIDVILNLT